MFSCYIFSHYIAIFVRRETERKSAHNLPVFSDNPLVVVGVKRGVHGCQIALKTPWKIDLQHFSGPWHYLEGSWIGNLWAGDGIKMSSLLEKKENCPFSPSPSSLKNRQERKKHRGLRLWRRKGSYILIWTLSQYGGGSEHLWILNRLPQQGLEKVNHVKAALHFFFNVNNTVEKKTKKHVERVSILVYSRAKMRTTKK